MNPLRHFEDRFIQLLRLWLIVGILLRVTHLRDRLPGLSLVYYSTPWPVMAASFVLLAVHFWRRRQMHPVRRYAVFTVVAGFVWISTSWYDHPPREDAGGLRLVHWNVGRPVGGFDGIVRWLRDQQADVLLLTEIDPKKTSDPDRWRRAFPEYAAEFAPDGLALLVRGEILDAKKGEVGDSSFCGLYRVRVRGRELTVIQADLIAKPNRSRSEPIANMTKLALDAGRHTIVGGDMNTPVDSAHFRKLRETFRNAFEAAGHGLIETWPMLAPALSLDQVWLGPGLQVTSCRHPFTLRSDHLPVVVTFQPEL